jgi:hypothetical protein
MGSFLGGSVHTVAVEGEAYARHVRLAICVEVDIVRVVCVAHARINALSSRQRLIQIIIIALIHRVFLPVRYRLCHKVAHLLRGLEGLDVCMVGITIVVLYATT